MWSNFYEATASIGHCGNKGHYGNKGNTKRKQREYEAVTKSLFILVTLAETRGILSGNNGNTPAETARNKAETARNIIRNGEKHHQKRRTSDCE